MSGSAQAASPTALRRFVPGILLTDPVFDALCGVLDDLLAPLCQALDCLPAYLDPGTAPEHFLPWLASIVAADDGVPSGDTRQALAGAARAHGMRGTVAGTRVRAATAAHVPPADVEITESGGVRTSQTPTTGRAAGRPTALVTVRVPGNQDHERVRAAVTAALEPDRPVHCSLTVKVLPR